MKAKNLKLWKPVPLFLGLSLVEVCFYQGTIKNSNLYKELTEVHKIEAIEVTKNGRFETTYYGKEIPFQRAFLLKTPYYKEEDTYCREVYSVSADLYSKVEQDYIMKHLSSQSTLFQQEYLQDLIEWQKNHRPMLTFERTETTQELPLVNQYELSSITYLEDFSSVRHNITILPGIETPFSDVLISTLAISNALFCAIVQGIQKDISHDYKGKKQSYYLKRG